MQNSTIRRGLQRLATRKFDSVQLLARLIFGAFLLQASSGMANPADYPTRRINNNLVDLSPLILWWEKPEGVRPLKAWKRIQGTLEGEIGPAWKIRCRVEGDIMKSILLKSPPQAQLVRFRELQTLVLKLEQERASVQQIASLPAYSGWDWDVYGLPPTRTADFDRIKKAEADLRELDQRLRVAQEELAILGDKRGNFKIDTFALDMNATYSGRPVFNFGYIP